MSSFDEAFSRLSKLTNYERKRPDRPHRFDLSGMAALCAALGHPEKRLGKVVQVAGSKGKGTVTSMLAGMGRVAGLRTAAYFSPHVEHVLERVRIDGRNAPETALVAPLHAVADAMEPDEHTWFEAFTAAALRCFADVRPDLTVLEVGLGGRLDSTSHVPKHACAITAIELEHTKILGDTVEAVAAEKAGILRPGVPCVTMATGAALEVIESASAEVGAPLLVLGRDLHVDVLARHADGFEVDIRLPESRARLRLPVFARTHALSFGIALALLHLVDPRHVATVLAADPVSWLPAAVPPARFEVLSWNPPVVVDGAHTDGSFVQLASDLEATFPGTRFHLVFAIALGKRWQTGLGRLAALVDRAWVAPLVGKAGVPPEETAGFLDAAGVSCQVTSSIAEAVAAARSTSGVAGLLVTGSLYAAGDALRVLRPEVPEERTTCRTNRRSETAP